MLRQNKAYQSIFIMMLALSAFACGQQTEASKPAEPSPTMPQSLETIMTEQPLVIFETTSGNFTLELNQEKAPISVENFLSYVNTGFFDNTIFHRVIPDFMVQGGGFTLETESNPSSLMDKKGQAAAIKNEADNGLKNNRGSVAMARTSDVNSATSQFFINLSDNDFLNHNVRDFGYAVFAQVTEGMDVIDTIAKLPTMTAGMHANVPSEPIVIIKAYVKTGNSAENPAS